MISRIDSFVEEMKIAERAAREAGEIIMAFYGKKYCIEEKEKGQPVTAADLAANVRIQEVLLGRYPADGWLSEENKDDLKRLKASRVWIVDPIDGTKEFIQKVPQFSVSIALVVGDSPVLGVVYNPAEEKFFKSLRGQGAWLNGEPMRVSLREEPKGARLLVSRSEPRRKFRQLAETYQIDRVGSIAYRLALVGGGLGDGTVTFRSIHEWDVCAGVMIVEGAGGMVLDGEGGKARFNQSDPRLKGLVASNSSLVHAIQRMMREGKGTVS